MAMPVLWRNLTSNEQRELSKRFIQLPPDELSTFSDGDFYLFVQWLYGRSSKLIAPSIKNKLKGLLGMR